MGHTLCPTEINQIDEYVASLLLFCDGANDVAAAAAVAAPVVVVAAEVEVVRAEPPRLPCLFY